MKICNGCKLEKPDEDYSLATLNCKMCESFRRQRGLKHLTIEERFALSKEKYLSTNIESVKELSDPLGEHSSLNDTTLQLNELHPLSEDMVTAIANTIINEGWTISQLLEYSRKKGINITSRNYADYTPLTAALETVGLALRDNLNSVLIERYKEIQKDLRTMTKELRQTDYVPDKERLVKSISLFDSKLNDFAGQLDKVLPKTRSVNKSHSKMVEDLAIMLGINNESMIKKVEVKNTGSQERQIEDSNFSNIEDSNFSKQEQIDPNFSQNEISNQLKIAEEASKLPKKAPPVKSKKSPGYTLKGQTATPGSFVKGGKVRIKEEEDIESSEPLKLRKWLES